MHSLFYNKNNEILVKLNNKIIAEKIKKQALKKSPHRIETYLIDNNITTTKLRTAQPLLIGDIIIQITNKKEAEQLRKKES